ncbi:PepSY-like domain-containing protein [Spirosoma soli]|uniref:PepSY-like domain-containing protein n=1 Tax=Spirosoma soli TaxID=1770529 RepID=A0ABW5M9Q0_9BACT
MKKNAIVCLLALFSLTLWSCNQNGAVSPTDDAATNTARLASDTTGFFCRDSITKVAVADLPATITSYITTNYAGATINYAAKDDAGNFVVAITQNDQRKALLFNTDGTFNQELAVRGRGGKGPGRGPGRGSRNDSLTKITVADLPAAITSYVTTNFSSATITLAAKDENRGYFVMITINGERRTLLFNLDGTFNEEIVRRVKENYTAVAVTSLPAAITSYVTANYAGSTIVQAGKSSTGQFLVWVQQANARPVALVFAADGTFVQALKHRR